MPSGRSSIVVFLLVLLASVPASAVGLTDYSTHRPPSISLPPAAGSYVDPVFGTTVLRVTDRTDGRICVNAYAYWPALNADNSRLLIACDGVPLLYRFDPSTDQLARDGRLRGDDGVRVQFEGAFWSFSDADVLYALAGTRLYRLDVSRRGMAGTSLVRDFAGLFSYPFNLYQLQMSADDNVFTMHSRDPANGRKLDIIAYDRAKNRVFVHDRKGRAIDESKVDKQGRKVLVDFASGDLELWDMRSGKTELFAWGDPDDKPGGHTDMGARFMVNGDGWNTGLLVRRYDAMHGADNLKNIVQYKRPDGSLNWSISDHASLRTDDETFVVGSTYGGDGSYAAFEDELYLAYTDGSGFVRLAHTRGVRRSSSADFNYFAEPRAVVDRKGRFVVWSSDLGSTEHIDVLMLKIPQSLWPASTEDQAPPAPDAAPQGTAPPLWPVYSPYGCQAVPMPGHASPGAVLLLWLGTKIWRAFARTKHTRNRKRVR